MEIEDSKITACGILLISSDNKILAFARRGDKTKLGLPAGKREGVESLKECASREVFEETEIKIDLTDNNEVFYKIPDDKQRDGKEEYCATFIVRENKSSEEFEIGKANISETENVIEGFGLWVTPEEFIHAANSAFLDYNTALLKFAKLI